MPSPKPTVIILSAGASRRMFPLNLSNKGHLRLFGQSLINRTVNGLLSAGFKDIVVVVSHKDNKAGYTDKSLDPKVISQVKIAIQTKPLGQGDAILSAKKYIKGDFIVVSPYHIKAGGFARQLFEVKQKTKADCVLLGTETDQPSLFGIIEYHKDKVIRVIEKPDASQTKSGIKVVSIYLFNQAFLAKLEKVAVQEYSLEEAISKQAQESLVIWQKVDKSLPSLKYPWQFFDLLPTMFDSIKTKISPKAKISSTAVIDDNHGPVVIETGVQIGDFAKLVGPVYIGHDSLIGDYSFIRGSVIEPETVVGANTEIVRSIIMSNSSIHYSYIADSILAEKVKIGAGLMTANKRLDREKVKTLVDGKLTDTGRRTLGTIIGQQTQLAVAVKTMPGVLIGARQLIYPNEVVYKNIPHKQA